MSNDDDGEKKVKPGTGDRSCGGGCSNLGGRERGGRRPTGSREGALRPESGADPVRAEAGAGAGPPRAWEAGRSRIAWGGCWLVSGIGNVGAL